MFARSNKNLRADLRGREANTLVEVLIAMAIVGIMFGAIYTGITRSFAIIRATRENVRAIQMLQDKTEIMRLYTWDQLNTPGFVPTNFSDYFQPADISTNPGIQYFGTVTISNAPVTASYASDLKLVTVTVSWTSGVNSFTRQATTLVSHYGLQNYVYY